jgi:hypothetical protein
MKYIELIFCKLVWLSTHLSFKKRPTFRDFYNAWAYMMLISSGPISCVVLVLIYPIVSRDVLIVWLLASFICVNLPIELYLRKKIKKKRMVYNIEYMRSKEGCVLLILCVIFSILAFLSIGIL